MQIAVIGTGFVGVVTSAVFAKLGYEVFGLDIDTDKVAKLQQGEIPFFEPKLKELVAAGLQSQKLQFTASYEQAISNSDVIMIAVGTPSAPDGTADITYVLKAAESLAPYIKDHAIVAIKSTVPPRTGTNVRKLIEAKTAKVFAMASLPEFLREGNAVADTLAPDRTVIGVTEDWAKEILLGLHEKFPGDKVVVTPESAQMAKYTANAYLANRIVFINQIADLCEQNGADIYEVIQAIGKDRRIGDHYWYPGLGYGGSCFPKDVKELAAYARKVGQGDGLMVKLDQLNETRIFSKLHEFDAKVGGFEGKTVAVLGLSFKPNTTDLREAPSLKVIPYLLSQGARIKAYDPKAMNEAKKIWPQLTYSVSALAAVQGAAVIMVLVEWEELVHLSLKAMAKQAGKGAWLIDPRNIYDPHKAGQAGLHYVGIGRQV